MTEGTITKTVWNKAIPRKIEWDTNVPDSKRDILKLLSQTLTGYITEYEIKDNLFSAKVELCANLLYLPEGADEPQIAALSSSETIIIKQELPPDITWDYACPQLNVTGHSPAFLNSRKVGIRGQMSLQLCLTENITVPCPDTQGKDIQVLWDTVNTYTTPVVEEEQFPFSLTLPLPPGKPPVAEILEATVAIRNPDLKAISNKAVAKGNLEVKILYASTHSTVEVAEFSSPFTEILDVGSLSEDHRITYELKPRLHTAEIMQNEENESKNLSFYGNITARITSREEKTLSLICDAYSPKFRTKLLSKAASFECCKSLPEESVTVKDLLSLSDSQLEEILDVSCTPRLSGAKAENHAVQINGSLETRILYRNSSGIHCVTREIPFETGWEIADGSQWSDVSVNVDLNHFSYHILNQNNLEIRAGLTISVCLCRQETKEYVEAILPEEEAPIICDRAPIVAYIIKPGDTLFQIAKRYSTTVERLKTLNNVENDRNLKIGSYLIIE